MPTGTVANGCEHQWHQVSVVVVYTSVLATQITL